MTKHSNYETGNPYRYRDKEKTKAAFLKATGAVLMVKGFDGLGVNEISRQAGHDKKLISHHFGSYQNMIDRYIEEKDIWPPLFQRVYPLTDNPLKVDLEIFLKSVYFNLIDLLKKDMEMRQLLLWYMSNPLKSMANLNREWENQINHFITTAKPNFETELRSLLAMLYGGICSTFFAATTGFNLSFFGKMNLNDENDLDEFYLSVGFLIEQGVKELI